MKAQKCSHFNIYSIPGRKESPFIFMLHGYGADSENLIPITLSLDPEKQFNWVFPQAPIPLETPFLSSSYSWFPFSIEKFFLTIQKKEWELGEIVPNEEINSLCKKIDHLIDELGCPRDKIILGGFSQGSIVAMECVLRSDITPLALLLFSSAPLSTTQSNYLSKRPVLPPFLQSHGKQDLLLPYSVAERFNRMLLNTGWEGEFVSFDGGHEIPDTVLEKTKHFITSLHDDKG